jgi:hypothetical protein
MPRGADVTKFALVSQLPPQPALDSLRDIHFKADSSRHASRAGAIVAWVWFSHACPPTLAARILPIQVDGSRRVLGRLDQLELEFQKQVRTRPGTSTSLAEPGSEEAPAENLPEPRARGGHDEEADREREAVEDT